MAVNGQKITSKIERIYLKGNIMDTNNNGDGKGRFDLGTFQKRVRDKLESRSLTQKEVAKAIGKDARSFGHYISGSTSPDIETLKKLSDYFNVSADFLLGISADDGENNYHQIKVDKNTIMKVFTEKKEHSHDALYSFSEFHLHSNNMMGILITNSEYEPEFKKGSILEFDCTDTVVDEEQYYLFDINGRYIVRKAYPMDFSDKIKIVNSKGEDQELPKTQKVAGKLKGIRFHR